MAAHTLPRAYGVLDVGFILATLLITSIVPANGQSTLEVVHTFTQAEQSFSSRLIAASDGDFYGLMKETTVIGVRSLAEGVGDARWRIVGGQ
jgi:hypothetical protein